MFYKWNRGHTQLFWDIKKNQTTRQQMLNDIFVATFGEITDGTFVEIGANDGLNCGVCTPLADIGWTGVLVEANPEMVKVCEQNHKQNPNVLTVSTAVTNHSGKNKATLWGDGLGATCNEAYKEIAKDISWAGIGNGPGTKVDSVTLSELLETHNVPREFELLSVDVEGGEWEVFEGFDLALWKPKMMVVEMTDGHPDFVRFDALNERYRQLRTNILNAGYVEIFRDIANTVYVSSD